MNKEQAAAFIQALNLAQPFVPPVIFAGIAANPVARALEAVANGLVVLGPEGAGAQAGAPEINRPEQ